MIEYKKYRWFFTSSNTLVVGGKNATQNDNLLNEVKDKDYIVMHTSSPGSPFGVIIKDRSKVSSQELEECAIFTGCFSRAWKEGKKNTSVDMFTTMQLSKGDLKTGTWKVSGKVERREVKLELAITKQKGVLRAVPKITAKKPLMIVVPGKTDKKDMAPKFEVELGNISQEELMAALPAGGVKKA